MIDWSKYIFQNSAGQSVGRFPITRPYGDRTVRDLGDTSLHTWQQELGDRRKKTLITKDFTTHIILTVIKSLFEKFLGIRKTGEFVPRADGWCSDSDNEIDFRFSFASAPSRGGGIEQCSISQPRDAIHSYSPSTLGAVTNVAVTPAAKPCHVIAGRKYIGGTDSEL